MNILYFTPDFQHPKIPGSHRHYYFMRELAKRHQITLLTIAKSEVPDEAFKEISGLTDRLFTFPVNKNPNNIKSLLIKKIPVFGNSLLKEINFRRSVKELKLSFKRLVKTDKFDVVLFHGKYLYPVIGEFKKAPVIIDFCDATSMRILTQIKHEKFKALPLRLLRLIYVKRIEKKLLKKSQQVVFITARDAKAILGSNSKYRVIPNGVDLDFWQPSKNARQLNSIVFTGVMSYQPNEDAAFFLIKQIFPFVKKAVPNVQLFIVGRDPDSRLIESAKTLPDVTVTGFVKDVRTYLENTSVFVAPIKFASGLQNKILEAMSMSIPVVTTKVVADGLRLNGANLPLIEANNKEEFVKAIIRLLSDEKERKLLASQGRQYVENYFNWTKGALQFEKMCYEAINSKGRDS